MTKHKYFGTDGIRGHVGQWPISADFMLQLGRALGTVLAAQNRPCTGHPLVLLGKDTRVSGYMFESALEAGLVAAGAQVRLLGPMPTPAVAYLTRNLRADAGIVISASHNPHHDNGVKFFLGNGEKLSEGMESAIERELDEPFFTVDAEKLGKVQRVDDAMRRYAEFCKTTVPEDFSLQGMHIVLDCANGATYRVAPKVFAELGAHIIPLGMDPNGFNINHEVGSTCPEIIAKKVLECGADLGIAFDGDGDRVQMVDRHGTIVDGDDMLYILARSWHTRGLLNGVVVGTLMSNYGLQRALENFGVNLVRANVGDRYVLQQLKEQSSVLGGETSGHILCLDRASTGDGIVAALAVLEALLQSGMDLAEARSGLQKLPQRTLNIRVHNAHDVLSNDLVCQEQLAVEKILAGRGRLVLRASGTEPLVRITVESSDAMEVSHLVARLARVIEQAAKA